MQVLEQWQSFSKNSHSDLDLKPRTLKVKLARDIIKSNIYMKLYYKRAMSALESLTWKSMLLCHIFFATQAEDMTMILPIIRVRIGRGWKEEHSCEINFIIITG